MLARWVLIIGVAVSTTGGCDRNSSRVQPQGNRAVDAAFTDMTAEAGLSQSVIQPTNEGDFFMPDSMGPGAALFDFDSDGDLDIYWVIGRRVGSNHEPSNNTHPSANRLFRQDSGSKFVDVTRAAGVGHRGYGVGVATGDIDNDGDVDLYVSNYGPDVLYRNDGDGTFSDITPQSGITDDEWSTSAVFFDADADGLLDLYVTRYLSYEPSVRGRDSAGRGEYPAPSVFPGVVDRFYVNRGDAIFEDATDRAGIRLAGKGLGVVATDLNDDGLPDLYIANDGDPNFAWVQQGDGTFVDQALEMGLSVNEFGKAEAGMGVACGDVDGDGDDDLFVTHLVQETNTLYRRHSPGRFEDATMTLGLAGASIDRTGFGTAFVDFDLDGDLDVLIANGRVLRGTRRSGATLSRHWAPYAENNALFINDGAGGFSAQDSAAGAFASDFDVSRGLAIGDIDADGDPDVLVTNANGNLKLYRNRAGDGGSWLIVEAFTPVQRRLAIGAIVEVRSNTRNQRRTVTTAGSYLSSSDPRCYFGLGSDDRVDEIRVRWPGSTTWELFPGTAIGRVVRVEKGTGQ